MNCGQQNPDYTPKPEVSPTKYNRLIWTWAQHHTNLLSFFYAPVWWCVCAKSQHDPRPHARAPLPPPQDTLSQTPQYNNQRYRRGEHPPHAVHARVRETTATGENRTPGPHQKEGRTTAAFRKSCPLPPAPGAVFGSNAVTVCGKCAITAGVLPAVLETRGEELGREKECDLTTLREQSPRVSMRPGEGVNSSLARVPFRSSGESAETAPAGPGPKSEHAVPANRVRERAEEDW